MPDKLESLWDLPQQIKDGQQVITLINEVKALILTVPKIVIEYKGASETKLATDQLVVANQNLITAQKALTNVQQQVSQSTTDLINQRIRLKNSIDSLNATQKEDLALLKEGTITQAEYKNRLTETTQRIEQLKIRTSDLNKEIKSSIGTKAQLVAQEKAEAKIAAELSSDYKQLQLAYEGAAKRAKDMSAALGIQHPLAVQAQKDAVALGTQLKSIDASVGQNQRNVGNYTSALSKAWGGLRSIAMILPGIGVAGLIGFAVDPIINWIKQINGATEAQKKLNSVIDEAKSGYVSAAMEVSNVKIAIEQAKNGIIKKEEAVKLYNETIGKTTGYVKSLDEAEQQIVKNGDAYIQFMYLKTAANLSLQKAAEKAIEAQQRQQNPVYFEDNWTTFGMFDFEKRGLARKAAEINKKEFDDLKKEEDDFRKIADKYRKEAEDYAKQYKFDYNGIKEPSGGSGKTQRESTKAMLDSDFEEYKIHQQRKIKLLGDMVNDENRSYDFRIAMLQRYSVESIALINKQAENDKKIQEEKLKAQQENLKKAKGTERNNLLIEIQNTNTAIRLIEAKAENARLEVFDANQKKFDEVTKQYNDKLKKDKEQLYKDLVDYAKKYGIDVDLNLETEQFEKIKQLDRDFASGRIQSIKQYREEKEKIELEYNKREIKSQLDVQYYLLDLAKANGKSTVDIEKQILELKKKLYQLDTKNFLAEAEKKLQKEKETSDARKRLQDEAEKAAIAAFSGIFDRKKNEIEEEKQALDAQTQAKIDAVNNELISEEKKAAKISAIQATAAARRQVLENKQKELDYKKAIFDRGIAIADVVKDTARAVAADLKDKKYLIPFDIAIGAAQIAAILATPIPKFEEGTESSPEGWAMTDEKGSELYIKPDGSMEIGNNKPTLRYLEAGTKIIPHDEVNEYMMKIMMRKTAALFQQRDDKKIDEVKEAVMWGAQQTIKELKKKKNTSVNVYVDSGFNSYIKKQVFD